MPHNKSLQQTGPTVRSSALRRQADRLETLAAVKQGLADVAAGRTRPMREALAELASKHGLAPARCSVGSEEEHHAPKQETNKRASSD